MDPTISTAALAAAEKTLNKALEYDPGTRMALGKLAPQVLAIKLTAPDCCIYLAPAPERTRLLGHYEGDITTQLQGTLPALLSLINSDNMNLKDTGVQLIGSTSFVAELQKILRGLDIDWEEMLSQLFGDIAGHQGADIIRSRMSWTKDRVSNIQRLTAEFLTEELRALPGKAELEFFYAQVDELTMDVDRVQARLELLAEKWRRHQKTPE